jgi:pyruvate,water dikinase
MQTQPNFIIPLSDTSAGLALVGGKGASLARMIAAGLAVPPGFTISTNAYRRYVDLYGLQEAILAAAAGAEPDQPAALADASRRIAALFRQYALPENLAGEIGRAYAELGGDDLPVAVRSSATAEDLPEMSFAGQQESYLNVRGTEAVLEAVRKCWASLWTERAIAYRLRQGIPADSVALAVVVQMLIPADAAGVLFTANPLNGARDEVLINANWGLGEALVSGRVSPDTLVMSKKDGRLLKVHVAIKDLMTIAGAHGTLEVAVPAGRRAARVLSYPEARQLAGLARRVEELYGSPQDVEWCRARGKFYIVQSRPITRLPLEWATPEPGMFYARSSLAEFLPGPLSPLFETFGVAVANQSSREMMERMAQMKWKYDFYTPQNGFMYTGAPLRPRDLLFYTLMMVRMLMQIRRKGIARWEEARETLRSAAAAWEECTLDRLTPAELLVAAHDLMKAATDYYGVIQASAIPMGTMAETGFTQLYNHLIRRKTDPDASLFLVGSETDALRAEKSLFEVYTWVRERPELAAWLGVTPAVEIVAQLSSGSGPETLAPDDWQGWVERLRAHQRAWGHLLYDFDFASPLLREDPLPAIEALKNHLAGRGADPNLRQRRQLEERARLRATIHERLDPLRRKGFEQSLDQAVARGPQREDAIAAMGFSYPALRRVFAELGTRLVRAGGIEQPGEIYWLRAAELEEAIRALAQNQPLAGMGALIRARQATHQQRLTLSPPPMLPRDSFLSKLMPPEDSYQAEGKTLKGIGVSGGQVTAPACVILSPEDFARMRPGDVLVAVNTTPAWTPLFALAAAVVTDIGGPLSHSSIVAREYGIPAVMATGSATHRIRNGQMITVDGGTGMVTLRE